MTIRDLAVFMAGALACASVVLITWLWWQALQKHIFGMIDKPEILEIRRIFAKGIWEMHQEYLQGKLKDYVPMPWPMMDDQQIYEWLQGIFFNKIR